MKYDISYLITGHSASDQTRIKSAYKFAQIAHTGQKRFSGEEYFSHPFYVAEYLQSLKVDADSIIAALLHDVVEDTPVKIERIKQEFGETVANLVDGLSKVSTVRLTQERATNTSKDESINSVYLFERQLNILRKMFLAMAKDIRVVLIKLADRRHNMQTLQYVPKNKQYRIARETIEIYAPLAHRLGIGELKGELEDLAFPYIYPEEYQQFKKQLGDSINEHELYINQVKKELSEAINLFDIKHEIDGRVKHFYSLYKKLSKRKIKLNQVYDLVACRVMVNNIEECYTVLGIVHQVWKPLKGTIKDYISIPKPNGYQSLHTTVFGPNGQITEIQIRTFAMHQQAEKGVAAHWHYTNQLVDSDSKQLYAPNEETLWVKKLSELLDGVASKKISPDDAKIDFFEDRIFVFTPNGDVHELPFGAVPIDFAYSVHTEIGNTCVGAKINGKMVTLSTTLNNGDMVEIVTKKNNQPKKDWLKFVKTAHAKTVIKHMTSEK